MIIQGRKKGEVTFVFNQSPSAKEVFLAGDFNQWDTAAKRMTKAKDGTFRARLNLQPGEYQYRFLADGQWISDPDAPGQVPNQFGTQNSLVKVD